MSIEKHYRWGKKSNEDVSIKEKRSTILKGLREEEDMKEFNRRKAWANFWDKRWVLSKAQKAAGARKLV